MAGGIDRGLNEVEAEQETIRGYVKDIAEVAATLEPGEETRADRQEKFEGLIERFRSLPMARSAVLAGRTLADLVRNVFVVALMFAVGFAVGWRVHTGLVPLIGAVLLILLFGYALSWIFATVGLVVKDPETAQAAAFPILAPLVFASNAFVPVASMPDWLQPWAEHQPVSVVITAVRDLTIGGHHFGNQLIKADLGPPAKRGTRFTGITQ